MLMMNDVFLRYPGGVDKAVIFSYDDGRTTDIKLVNIFDKYGVKGTFNLVTGDLLNDDPKDDIHLKKKDAVELFKNSVHEVALHGHTHPFFDLLPNGITAYEVIKSREIMEDLFERPIRGMAYPNGAVMGDGRYSDEIVMLMKNCGIAYARTTDNVNNFRMCGDWLRMGCTCHHNEPKLMELAKKFAETKVDRIPRLFSVWGHSFEFEQNNNWDIIDELCSYLVSRNDIWFATCIELYDYVEAYNNLKFSVNGKFVYNPSNMTIYIAKNFENIEIKPGTTVKL